MDCLLRDLLTRVGGYDGTVTQFARVSASALPLRTFRRICPELSNGSRTVAGTPVAVQLLGNCPERLAESARRLAGLLPAGIDLNFGCPAPTVNRHGGGAVLLDDPELMRRIACAVRCAVPEKIPVTAKMRLGVQDTSKTLECALALESAGIDALVVHARTKLEAYRPPAHWEWIARVREAISLPVVANGEIWTVSDYVNCRAVSGCTDVMIGRGALADPFLAIRIRAWNARLTEGGKPEEAHYDAQWRELLPVLNEFWQRVGQRVMAKHAPGRLKLWLNSLRRHYQQAETLYQQLRTVNDVHKTELLLAAQERSVK